MNRKTKTIIPIVPYLEKLYVLPNGDPVQLFPHQEAILKAAFTPDAYGKLPYRQVVYSCPKKSGKTAIGAMIANWFAFSGVSEQNSEIFCCANDLEQSQGRIYKALKQSIEQSPILKKRCTKIHEKLIELNTGTQIQAIAGDYAGAAGANPEMSLFDELWGFRSESSRRLFEEMTPSPARYNSLRVIVTYAGIMTESELLEEIYRYVIPREGDQTYRDPRFPDLPVYQRGDAFVYWDHSPRMPWQTPEYYESERNQPGFRMSAYLRIHENRWVESEEGLDMGEWDQCVEIAKSTGYHGPVGPSRNIQLAVAVDASTKKDRAAVVTCFKKDGCIWLGPRMFWQPSKENPLQFEETIEKYILELQSQYDISILYYDPWQFERSAQLLRQQGIICWDWPQTQPNTIKMSEYLLDLLRGRKLMLWDYEDQNMKLRREAQSVSIKEIPGRGRRFVKDNENKKIDSIIALAMAAMACGEHCPDIQELRGQFMLLGNRKTWNPSLTAP